jgi:hypothetical protein
MGAERDHNDVSRPHASPRQCVSRKAGNQLAEVQQKATTGHDAPPPRKGRVLRLVCSLRSCTR